MSSEWTVQTLHEHLQLLAEAADLRYQQRFADQEKAVNAALTAAKEAVAKAEVAAEKRFDAVNEFRAQLADQASTFMPRLESEQRQSQIEERVAAMESRFGESLALVNSRLDLSAGKSRGMDASWGYLVAVVAVAISVGGLIVGLR